YATVASAIKESKADELVLFLDNMDVGAFKSPHNYGYLFDVKVLKENKTKALDILNNLGLKDKASTEGITQTQKKIAESLNALIEANEPNVLRAETQLCLYLGTCHAHKVYVMVWEKAPLDQEIIDKIQKNVYERLKQVGYKLDKEQVI